ncbi:hypothetical protein [Caldicellulosiruptor morganii]|uniref:Uncharacterized protein n=1 Tax=Caldicellulosiruptor morganii TaxID=1387555 RepID=A0ABY7BNC2_9FIRM|nr:hypothetical protein [Caldicellulosiruptor morganii]WAM34347.1 hypothetical protein OTK00_000532 [Caldicellulosiruptor morganii]
MSKYRHFANNKVFVFRVFVCLLVFTCLLSNVCFAAPEEVSLSVYFNETNVQKGIVIPLVSWSKSLTIPNGGGTLTSNVWRSTFAEGPGNTLNWDYQVSAVYEGNKKVLMIKTEWWCTASLRNSASISMSITVNDKSWIESFSAGASSSWQTVSTRKFSWTNDNGAKISWYRSNFSIGPKIDYRDDSVCTYNTAYVKVQGYSQTFMITASI